MRNVTASPPYQPPSNGAGLSARPQPQLKKLHCPLYWSIGYWTSAVGPIAAATAFCLLRAAWLIAVFKNWGIDKCQSNTKLHWRIIIIITWLCNGCVDIDVQNWWTDEPKIAIWKWMKFKALCASMNYERMKESLNQSLHEEIMNQLLMNKWMNDLMDERTNEWTNEWRIIQSINQSVNQSPSGNESVNLIQSMHSSINESLNE